MKAKLNMMSMQDGDIKKSHADVTDLIRYFGYTPEWDIKKGTKEFIKWYLGYYKVKCPPYRETMTLSLRKV
jgi:UDP-glucuronate 4-epimerase